MVKQAQGQQRKIVAAMHLALHSISNHCPGQRPLPRTSRVRLSPSMSTRMPLCCLRFACSANPGMRLRTCVASCVTADVIRNTSQSGVILALSTPGTLCRLWCFKPEDTLRRLLADPDVRAHVLSPSHRTTSDGSTFWGSPQFRQLNQDCAGVFDSALLNAVLVSIGGDGVNIVNWGSRTATVIALKLEDLPEHLVQKGLAVAPLIVIEGPQEPSNLDFVYDLVVPFFQHHAPSADHKGAILFPSRQVLAAANTCCPPDHTGSGLRWYQRVLF